MQLQCAGPAAGQSEAAERYKTVDGHFIKMQEPLASSIKQTSSIPSELRWEPKVYLLKV